MSFILISRSRQNKQTNCSGTVGDGEVDKPAPDGGKHDIKIFEIYLRE